MFDYKQRMPSVEYDANFQSAFRHKKEGERCEKHMLGNASLMEHTGENVTNVDLTFYEQS